MDVGLKEVLGVVNAPTATAEEATSARVMLMYFGVNMLVNYGKIATSLTFCMILTACILRSLDLDLFVAWVLGLGGLTTHDIYTRKHLSSFVCLVCMCLTASMQNLIRVLTNGLTRPIIVEKASFVIGVS